MRGALMHGFWPDLGSIDVLWDAVNDLAKWLKYRDSSSYINALHARPDLVKRRLRHAK